MPKKENPACMACCNANEDLFILLLNTVELFKKIENVRVSWLLIATFVVFQIF